MRMLTKIMAVAVGAALVLSLAGCGEDNGPRATAGAAADPSLKGNLTVYTSLPDDQSGTYLASFKKTYPNVKLKVVQATPGAIADKLIKEKKKPVADVVWHTPLSAVMRAIEASALAQYAYHPGQIDALGGDFVDHDNPSNPYYVGTDLRMVAFAVNTGKTGGAAPATLSDLLDPKYKDQIVAPSIKTDAGYAFVSSLMENKSPENAWQYLADLDKNVSYYTDDEMVAVNDVADGNIGVGLAFDGPIVKTQNDGGTIEAVFPGLPDMSPWEMDVQGLVKKSGSAKVAKAFLDWSISDPAMAAYAVDTPVTGVDTGAEMPSGYPETWTEQLMLPANWSAMAANRAKLVAEWTKRFGKKVKEQ
jgi:iron(III) transport system substrate-binding protein